MRTAADPLVVGSDPPAPAPTTRFVCLLYHDVFPDDWRGYGSLGDSATRYHVSLTTFERHLDCILERGLPVLTHNAMVLSATAPAPRGPLREAVGLTFDDGWRFATRLAAEALGRRGLPGTFFVTSGFLGRPHFADAEDLRRLDPALFTIGSHGATHRMLSSLDSAGIRRELSESKADLEQILGRAVTAVSIPGGAVDERVREMAGEAGYEAIFDSSIVINPGRRKARGIGRIGISRLTSGEAFERYLRFKLRREQWQKALLSIPKRVLGMRVYSMARRIALGETARERHHFQP